MLLLGLVKCKNIRFHVKYLERIHCWIELRHSVQFRCSWMFTAELNSWVKFNSVRFATIMYTEPTRFLTTDRWCVQECVQWREIDVDTVDRHQSAYVWCRHEAVDTEDAPASTTSPSRPWGRPFQMTTSSSPRCPRNLNSAWNQLLLTNVKYKTLLNVAYQTGI